MGIGRSISEFLSAKIELAGTGLIILAFALLPLGRAVEVPTVAMALWGVVLMLGNTPVQNSQRAGLHAFSVLFLLYWLPMATSVIDADDFSNSALFCFKYVRFFFAGYFVVSWLTSARIRRQVLSALAVVIALWLLDSLYQSLAGVDLLGRSYRDDRLTGPFKRLIMPVFLSVFFPLILIYVKMKWPNPLFWGFLALSLWVLFLAGSRASWFAVLLAGVLYGVYVFIRLENKPVIASAAVITGTIAIGVVCYHAVPEFEARIARTMMVFGGDYHSLYEASSHRLPIWQTAWRMALDHPLNGVGIKGFHAGYALYAAADDPFRIGGANHPHLFALEILVETGAIGFLAMLLAVAFWFKLSAAKLKSGSPLQAVCVITLAIIFLPLNAHVAFYSSVYSQVAWLMSAIALACLYSDDTFLAFKK